MQTQTFFRHRAAAVVALASLVFTSLAQAQELGNVLLEEIIVTATKRAGGVAAQTAPLAITAYGADQLDALHIRDLSALGFSAPSVQLEDIGTTRGTANFSIRGLGINSSIPSIDPTVGLFVDGMYFGLNAGVVLDIFDIESVEILRGPQGLLFGRNVTGGAVVINTTRPTDELTVKAKVAYETGDNRYLSAVIAGPISDSVGFKFAAYNNDDGGWHTNLFDGSSFGEAETTMIRGALSFDVNDSFDVIARVEVGQSEGDGPAAQNRGCTATPVPGLCPAAYDFEGFEFAVDERGFYDNTWTNIIVEANWDVAFGDGQITNILAYREYESSTLGDIDSTPLFLFHAAADTNQDQLSNELRYAGSFGDIYLTSGLYYFTQEFTYLENRQIPPLGFPPPGITGGGTQDQTTLGLFATVDWQVSDWITLNLGGRFTYEEKDAQIATISPISGCTLAGGCTMFDFIDSQDWDNFTPKVGIQIVPDDDTQYYAFWTKGFRSGGFNLRHTAPAIPNAAFDEEEQRSIEIGMKKDFAGGKVRVNLSAYRNRIENIQREVNFADPFVGVVQLVRNTADATIKGIDAELTAVLTDNLIIKASFGYLDGEYNEVLFDISGDGIVDDVDLALKIPRLAPLSYGGEIIYQRDMSWGTFSAQGSGYRRDPAFFTDNNLGTLREVDMINARLGFSFMDDTIVFSLFGKNLKDQTTIGGDTQLPFFPGATFSPLNKGRVYGVEVQYRMN